jgi:mannose/cellobiose epimerase-like protein (N-acyl-D-glucosamine 2-epimerase family)
VSRLAEARSKVRAWLWDHALPLWAERGVDPTGRFHEVLDFDGRPVPGRPRRTRVQARQVYVFAEAASLGWSDGAAIARRGLDRLIETCRRPDGLWISTSDDAGRPLDETPDLYDLAFVLFALAAAHRVLDDPRARPLALETLAAIDARMRSPHGGWHEALPPRLPRRQNPHMHLLEAMLAWQATAPDPAFDAAARESLRLCREHFLRDGHIHEYFTEDWRLDPDQGHVIEPGHLEEWAWLLGEAEAAGLDSFGDAPAALHKRAWETGQWFAFLVRETTTDGRYLDQGRRLWAQTEAIRTQLAMGETALGLATLDEVFATHLAVALPGQWLDSYDADGRPLDTVVPASTFYHLMTAFSELLRGAR